LLSVLLLLAAVAACACVAQLIAVACTAGNLNTLNRRSSRLIIGSNIQTLKNLGPPLPATVSSISRAELVFESEFRKTSL
jgi:hypothetical protein